MKKIARAKKEFTDLEAQDIVSLYGRAVSLREIGDRVGCSTTPIIKLLREKGIEAEPVGRKPLTEEEFEARSRRKRLHDEPEKYPNEKYDVPGAPWVDEKLKALGFSQSTINKVLYFYLPNWDRYSHEPNLMTTMLKACRIHEEVASFLADELNIFMYPRPGERLAYP